MRGFVFSLFFFFSALSFASAQAPLYSDGRFSVETPPEWKRKPKLLEELNDILSTQVEELKEKRFCINCEASYKVRFTISELHILDRTTEIVAGNNVQVVTYISFKGSLTVYDDQGSALTDFELVSPLTRQKIRSSLEPPRQRNAVTKTSTKRDFIVRDDISEDMVRRVGFLSADAIMVVFADTIKEVWNKLKKQKAF